MRSRLIVGVLALWSCQSAPQPTQSNNPSDKDTLRALPPALSPDPYWTDLSRILAGLLPRDTIYWRSAIRDTAWTNYATQVERLWSKRKQALYDSLLVWAARELHPYHTWSGKVFYPFSGADWATVYYTYPKGSFYLFFGLEQEGDPHYLRKLYPLDIVRNLRGTYLTLEDLLRLSFFCTKDMQVQLAQGKVRGLLPVFLALFARTGHLIYKVEHIYLKEGGVVDTLSPNKPKPAQSCWDNPITGLRFLVARPEEPIQEILYLSLNAANAGIQTQIGSRDILSRMRPCVTLIKSASYLMYGPDFTEIRDLILKQSVAILQEDSGMPFRSFDSTAWHIQLFGVYEKPIPLFRSKFQSDLWKAYRTYPVKRLPFNIGYHVVPGQSNLLWAVRKNPQATLPPIPDGTKSAAQKQSITPLPPRSIPMDTIWTALSLPPSDDSFKNLRPPTAAPFGGSE
ncbi:MAG: hypothetical protein NZZ60_05140 [Bacteroidia bacterium]|nr:hypothetical protein [Bacteroidia bacterium]MCX7652149.1 hypothetical protein [Bacteroidia bacterium]MDW8416902.1 hypothetical protein [Bacteroidia bacterium]